MFHKLFLLLVGFSKKLANDNINAYAASTAYFIFLSLIPMLITTCSILPYTHLTEGNLVTALTELSPDYMDGLVKSIVSQVYDKSVGVLSVAIVITIWSASKGLLALMRGLNVVNGVVENRNYILLRLVAYLYTVMVLVVTVFSLSVMVFGNVMFKTFLKNYPSTISIFRFLIHFRFLFVWVILTIVFVLLFTYIPNKKMKLRLQIPGAVFSAVSWSVFSWGFSVYVDRFNSFSAYGSLSTIIIVLLWLYFCIYIMLIGANINRYFHPFFEILSKKTMKNNKL